MSRFLVAVLAVGVIAGCGRPDPVLYGDRLLQERPGRSARQEVRLTWLGVAGFWIEDGQDGVLIDPYVSRNVTVIDVALKRPVSSDRATVADAAERLGMQHARLIVVSHSHFDHSLDAPEFARQTGAKIVGSSSTAALARAAGISDGQIVVGEDGRELTAGAFRVRLVRSQHGKALFGRVPWPGEIAGLTEWPVSADRLREGGTFGVIIEHPLGTIVHHGSAGWVDGMYSEVQADVVLLGLAGRGDTGALLDAVPGALGASRVVAMHFDDFFQRGARLSFLPFVDFDGFVEAFDRWSKGRNREATLWTAPLGEPRVVFREN